MSTVKQILHKISLLLMGFIILVITSCEKDKKTPHAVLSFIYSTTDTYYLWDQYIPTNIDINNYSDPVVLFEDMYYPTLDHWSFVTENYLELQNSLDGIEKSTGYKIQLFKFPNVDSFPQPSVNLDLSRLFVLTSNGTASASEALINGLKPYMDVVIIGDTTVGKYTGASLFWDETSTTSTWGIYLVVNKIANVNGETDFVDGFAPNYPVIDDYISPLGDVSEPLLSKAI